MKNINLQLISAETIRVRKDSAVFTMPKYTNAKKVGYFSKLRCVLNT